MLGAVLKERPGKLHAPTPKDYDAWTGAPKSQIETHRFFATLPREPRPISDGSELWILRHCPSKAARLDECCLHQFVLKEGMVSQYRTTGPCGFSCEMRPEPKIQACVALLDYVPDGQQ